MVKVQLPNDFVPRPYQEKPMLHLDSGGRKVMWVVHRRGGKDLTMMHQTVKMMYQRRGVYWHVFPSFSQARKAIWEGFRRDEKRIMENVFPGFLDPKRPGSIVSKKDDQQMSVQLKNGSIWRLLGSDRVELVGAGPVGVVFSEYALSNPRARNLISPMLKENDGWEAYITTPRGRNHAKELYDIAVADPTWFCDLQTLLDTDAWQTMLNKDRKPYKSAEELMDEERADGMPDAIVKQEYLCDWSAALVGAVWGDLVDQLGKVGGLSSFQPDYGTGVFTSWDLGYTDSTAIWFWQVVDGGVDLIDYYEDQGKPLSHYYEIVEAKPYRYVKHWLPHDARQTTLSSGVSILNQCLARWPGMVAIGPDLPKVDSIQAGRWLFQQGLRIHPRCDEKGRNGYSGLDCLREYHYEYDEEKKTFSPNPAHTWASHGADAFRYLAGVAKRTMQITERTEVPKAPKPVAVPLNRSFTLNQLFDDRARLLGQRRRI